MTSHRFDYLLDKVRDAEFVEEPFKHLYIEDLFTPDDFEAITSCPEIAIAEARDDDDLFQKLFDAGYKIIDFPGCTTDMKA